MKKFKTIAIFFGISLLAILGIIGFNGSMNYAHEGKEVIYTLGALGSLINSAIAVAFLAKKFYPKDDEQ